MMTICTFQSVNELKIHLTWLHSETVVSSGSQMVYVSFICPLCGFKQPFDDKTLLSHLSTQLKQHEMLDCSLKKFSYRTNVYSLFNAHKSTNHPDGDFSNFKNEIILTQTDCPSV